MVSCRRANIDGFYLYWITMRKIFLPPELYMGIEKMDTETKWLLFDAIYRYNLWLDYELDENIKMIFWFFKPFFDNDQKVYDNFCESRRNNGKLWGRPKASIIGDTDNPRNKPKKATKAKQPTEMTWHDMKWSNSIVYSKEYIYNKIDKESLKKEFPKKNFDIEFEKMWNNRDSRWKKIKKPNQAMRNWLLPKPREKEYIDWIADKTDEQWITEFLAWKTKFHDKYWRDKYQEVKDKRIQKCLSQPLSL